MENAKENFAVFLIPGPATGEDEAVFMTAIAENDDADGDLDNLPEFLPENWESFVPHMWPIEKIVADMERSPNFGTDKNTLSVFQKDGVTHVVIVESNVVMPDTHPIRLGMTEIKGNSMMLLYVAERQKYRLFHCSGCAYSFSKWLEEKQPEWWDVTSPEFQAEANTLN